MFGYKHYLTLDLLPSSGGIRRGIVEINGQDVYRHLKHEAGVHRVQRVPKTEKAGRVHTSTITVSVLPQPGEVGMKHEPQSEC